MKKTRNKILRKIVAGIVVGAITAIVTISLALINPFQSWHLKLSNTLFTKTEPSEDIVIVRIDEKSLFRPPAGLGPFEKWRRTYYADIIQKLNEASAKIIGIDLYFSEPSQDIPQTTIDALINQTRSSIEEDKKNTIYESFIQYDPSRQHPDDIALKNQLTSNVILNSLIYEFTTENNQNTFQLKDTLLPLSYLRNDSFENVAIANSNMDSDGVVREVPLTFNDENGNQYESFALKIANKFTNNQIDTSQIPIENGRMLINFFAKPYSYKYVSFNDVYNDIYDSKDFKDKIVLIGVTTTAAAQDHHITPSDVTVPMPGVEIHANAIQTILDEQFLVNQSQVSQIATIAAIAVLAAIALNFLNIWLGIAIAFSLVLAYTGSAHVAYSKGLIINMVYPYIGILLTYAASIIYKYFAELKAKMYIQTAFGRYLSPNVLQEVLKNPDLLHLGGTKREVTVFFSDIAGFTTLSESLDPQHLIMLVNDYLSTMTEIIMKHEGTLDKYVGDAIVAYFGAPKAQEDHAKRACAVALEMREILPKLNEKWKHEGYPLVDFRVGINTGNVVVGNVGSEHRFDYTIMGDEANLGSRLEGANKKYGTHIMISESTVAKIENDFIVRELDLLKVKGKEKPVRVYELLARKGKLSETGQALLAPYNFGIRLYKERKFKGAHDSFKRALQIYPDDEPSKVYAQRCDILSNYPPPDDWDGVFTMQTK